MFKKYFALMLALCLLLTSASVAYMEEADNDVPSLEAVEEALPEADEEVEEVVEEGEFGVAEDEAADGFVEAPVADEPVVDPEPAAPEAAPAVQSVVAEEIADESAKLAAEASMEASTTELVLTGNAKRTVSRGDMIQLNLNGQTAKSFKSSKKSVAGVTATGLVTAKAKGKAKITVTLATKKKLTLTLTVVDPTIPTAVSFTVNGAPVSGTITVNKNQSVTLVPVASTASGAAADTGFKWKTANKKVATCAGGVIKGKKEGTTKITVTTTRGKKKATIKVKVVDPYKATKVTLNETGLIYLFKGAKLQLTAAMEPSYTTSTLKWSSSKKAVATVNQKGLVTGRKLGKTIITCKTSSGKKARVTIKVIKKGGTAKGIIPEWSPDAENHFVYRGAVDTYVVSMNPFNANANVVWTSDNPAVLNVIQYARSGDLSFWCDVQGVSLGSATLTARDTVSGLTASVIVSVKEPPAPESISLPMGGVVTMGLNSKLDVPYVVNPSTSLNSDYNRATLAYNSGLCTIGFDANNADRNCLGTMDYNLHITSGGTPGSTTVTITLRNGVTASFTLVIG